MTDDPEDVFVLMCLKISKAHPHLETLGPIFTRLTPEHPSAGAPEVCKLLGLTLYGAKDAAKNLENLIAPMLREAGVTRGKMKHHLFYIS